MRFARRIRRRLCGRSRSSNPGDEALSNRLLDIERDGMEADETRDFAQRYEAAALAGDMAEGYESLADCLGTRIEVNASGPGSSAADCVNSRLCD